MPRVERGAHGLLQRPHVAAESVPDQSPVARAACSAVRLALWFGQEVTMAVSVCPGDEFKVSADVVWSLLADPARLDAWWDARLLHATPPGPLVPGQHIVARAKGAFPARLSFDVT